VAKRAVWSRRLPQALVIPTVMTLKTLGDVRECFAIYPNGRWLNRASYGPDAGGRRVPPGMSAAAGAFCAQPLPCWPPWCGKRMGKARSQAPNALMVHPSASILGVRIRRTGAEHLESSVSFVGTGGHYFPLREMSLAKAVSVVISAGTLLLIGSNIIAQAATLEEVARCRGIQISSERWQCFKSLSAPKRNVTKTKRDDTPKAHGKDAPKTEDVPKAKSEDVPAAASRSQQEAPDDPESTSSINRLRAASGQPLCIDQDSLAAALIAGVLASSPAETTTNGCQTIPEDAEVEVIERFPSGFQFLRVVKVKVTSRTQPEPLAGYTIDIGR
jgi:hypothetical protein